MAEQQPGYVFNLDRQLAHREFVIVCEGPMDAIGIDGLAIMGSEINSQQRMLIDQLKRTVIVVPDRDANGKKLVEQAIEYNWAVSLPDWSEGIKDINDAVRTYGKLTTLLMIKQNQMTNDVKIKLTAKEWFK
jgi:DNA primase